MDSLDLLAYQEGGTSGVIYPSGYGVAQYAKSVQILSGLENRLHARSISAQVTSGCVRGMCKALLPALIQILTPKPPMLSNLCSSQGLRCRCRWSEHEWLESDGWSCNRTCSCHSS